MNATARAIIHHTNITNSTYGIVFDGSSNNTISEAHIAFNAESGVSILNERWPWLSARLSTAVRGVAQQNVARESRIRKSGTHRVPYATRSPDW
ncbi:MAG: hypothetical protein ACE5QF_04145 [Thermoplasmata archaeon]